jgi:hypothetical protein
MLFHLKIRDLEPVVALHEAGRVSALHKDETAILNFRLLLEEHDLCAHRLLIDKHPRTP